MGTRGDDGFEVVEFGHSQGDAIQQPEPTLAPLDLGDRPTALDPPQAGPWQRWAGMAAVFAIGVIGGSYGWQARTDTLDAARVDLIATSILGGQTGTESSIRLFAEVHNLGAHEVTVVDAHPAGWSAEDARGFPDGVTIAAGSAANVPMVVQPRCDLPVPDQLEASVSAEAGLVATTVPLPRTASLEWAHHERCLGLLDDIDGRFWLNWIPSSIDTEQPGLRDMTVTLILNGRDAEVSEVAASAAGFYGTATNLPLAVGSSTSAELTLRWTITDCTNIGDLGDVELVVTLTDGDDGVTVSPETPPWLIVELARFAGEECGP